MAKRLGTIGDGRVEATDYVDINAELESDPLGKVTCRIATTDAGHAGVPGFA